MELIERIENGLMELGKEWGIVLMPLLS